MSNFQIFVNNGTIMVIGHTTMVVSFKSKIMGDRWGFMDGLGSSGTGMQNNKIWKEVRKILHAIH